MLFKFFLNIIRHTLSHGIFDDKEKIIEKNLVIANKKKEKKTFMQGEEC